MVEKRKVTRHRVLKAGTIKFFGGGVIDCIVRNVSNEGAALQVATPFGIPGKFTLVIPADGLHFACRVIWRKGLRLGVTFDLSNLKTPRIKETAGLMNPLPSSRRDAEEAGRRGGLSGKKGDQQPQ